MAFGSLKTPLEELAAGNARRTAVLAGRASRSKSRSRMLTCTACGESGYAHRDTLDICDECLRDLWGAQDVLAGAYSAGRASGCIPIRMTNVAHWWPYPHLATNSAGGDKLPERASFARARSSSDVLRALFVDLLNGLSAVLPCDPESRVKAKALVKGAEGGYRSENQIAALLPAQVVGALRDLWSFVEWHSQEAYRQGFEAGHDLLMRLNLGSLTADGLAEEIADQTKNRRAACARAIKENALHHDDRDDDE